MEKPRERNPTTDYSRITEILKKLFSKVHGATLPSRQRLMSNLFYFFRMTSLQFWEINPRTQSVALGSRGNLPSCDGGETWGQMRALLSSKILLAWYGHHSFGPPRGDVGFAVNIRGMANLWMSELELLNPVASYFLRVRHLLSRVWTNSFVSGPPRASSHVAKARLSFGLLDLYSRWDDRFTGVKMVALFERPLHHCVWGAVKLRYGMKIVLVFAPLGNSFVGEANCDASLVGAIIIRGLSVLNFSWLENSIHFLILSFRSLIKQHEVRLVKLIFNNEAPLMMVTLTASFCIVVFWIDGPGRTLQNQWRKA